MKKKVKPKKNPADYPQMNFRVSQADKERLSELIEKVTDLHNKTRLPHMRVVRKNDIIVDSLFYGLLRLEKGLGKLLVEKANREQ
jgi:hypothetical protein